MMPTPITTLHTLRELGEFEPAVLALIKASQLNPGYFGIHNNLGNIHQEVGHLDEAAAAYSKAIEFEAGSVEAFISWRRAHASQGKLGRSGRRLPQAIAISRTIPRLTTILAGR